MHLDPTHYTTHQDDIIPLLFQGTYRELQYSMYMYIIVSMIIDLGRYVWSRGPRLRSAKERSLIQKTSYLLGERRSTVLVLKLGWGRFKMPGSA